MRLWKKMGLCYVVSQWLQPLGDQLSARHPHPNTVSINTSQQCMLNVLRAEPWGCSQPERQCPVETACDFKPKNSLIIRTWGTHVSSILTLTLLSTPSIKSSHRVWIILSSTSCSACCSSSKARVMCSQAGCRQIRFTQSCVDAQKWTMAGYLHNFANSISFTSKRQIDVAAISCIDQIAIQSVCVSLIYLSPFALFARANISTTLLDRVILPPNAPALWWTLCLCLSFHAPQRECRTFPRAQSPQARY